MSEILKFEGKVALVTGSSSGIGEEYAYRLAELGANVVINGTDERRIKSVAEKCEKISDGKRMLSFAVDLSNDEEVKNLLDSTIEEFGRLDILVNNAFKGDLTYSCDQNSVELYDKIMEVNVRSVVHLISMAIPYLEKTKGTIINNSEENQASNTTFKSMSKCCIEMLTKCLAIELEPKGIQLIEDNDFFNYIKKQ